MRQDRCRVLELHDVSRVALVARHAGAGAARVDPMEPSWSQPAASQKQPQPAKQQPVRSTSDLKIGDRITAKVTGILRDAFVDIGTGKDATLEYGEMIDGFPSKGMPVKRGEQFSVRVLEVDQADKVFVTRRTGDLQRPPRLAQEDKNNDPEPLRICSDEEWLDAEVLSMTNFGVFVIVFPCLGKRIPVLALLRKENFERGFTSDPSRAVRGGQLKVRKLGLDEKGKMRVTMKQYSGKVGWA